MAIIARAVAHGLEQGGHKLGGIPWLGKGFSALGRVPAVGLSAAYGYYNYSHNYGLGTAAIYAIASYYPITGVPLFILTQGYELANDMYQKKKSQRKSSFAKASIDDRFGTINKMRQYSHQQLLQDHSSRQRTIGNEAFFLHR